MQTGYASAEIKPDERGTVGPCNCCGPCRCFHHTDDTVHPYRILRRKGVNLWYTPVCTIYAHNAEEAAETYAEESTCGGTFIVESEKGKVMRIFQSEHVPATVKLTAI